MMEEDLQLTVEGWTKGGNIERLLARSAGMLAARGAFDAAVLPRFCPLTLYA